MQYSLRTGGGTGVWNYVRPCLRASAREKAYCPDCSDEAARIFDDLRCVLASNPDGAQNVARRLLELLLPFLEGGTARLRSGLIPSRARPIKKGSICRLGNHRSAKTWKQGWACEAAIFAAPSEQFRGSLSGAQSRAGTSKPEEDPILPERMLKFDDFELYPRQRLLLKRGTPVRIGSRAFDALVALTQRAGQVVTKDELITSVWPNVTADEVSLRVQILSLRRALGDGSVGGRFIASVTGRGYSFVTPVIEVRPEVTLSARGLQTAHALAVAGKLTQPSTQIFGCMDGKETDMASNPEKRRRRLSLENSSSSSESAFPRRRCEAHRSNQAVRPASSEYPGGLSELPFSNASM